MIPYYNATSDGVGFPGIITYTNNLVDGWLVNGFLIFIFMTSLYVGSKSEWKMSGVVSLSFFLSFVTGMLFSVIAEVNPVIMYCLGIGLAISVLAQIITSKGGG